MSLGQTVLHPMGRCPRVPWLWQPLTPCFLTPGPEAANNNMSPGPAALPALRTWSRQRPPLCEGSASAGANAPPVHAEGSGHRRHRHLPPLPVAGLLFQREDGNVDFSCPAPLCRGGLRTTSLQSPPIGTFPSSSPGGDGLGSPPTPGHLTPLPRLLSSSVQSPWDGVTPRRVSWDVAKGGRWPGVQVKDECWHWHPQYTSQ